MSHNHQIKSKQRVSDHGEVFTHEREVNGMLDLVKNETERLDSRFLEPACGTGNFLAAILERKLAVLKQKYQRNKLEYEKYSVVVISSLYGIDLLEDNIIECRERLLAIFAKEFFSVFHSHPEPKFLSVLKFILKTNILCGDALTMKKTNGHPLVFSEWAFPYNDSRIKRKEYIFKDIIKPNLLWFSTNNDTGEVVVLPNVYKDHPLMNYLELSDND